MLIVLMLVTIIFSLDLYLIFRLQFFQIWRLFYELHCFSVTLLLPANHIWPVKSQKVGYAHVVEESKTKQTSKPCHYQQKTPPVIPSSVIWEDAAAAAKPGVQQSLGRVCLLGLYKMLFLGVPYFPRDSDVLPDHARVAGSFCINDGLKVPLAVQNYRNYTKTPG